MFKIWRDFVVWLRSLLLAIWLHKNPIKWPERISELLGIVIAALGKISDKNGKIEPIEPKKPAVTPTIPKYDIIPKPRFRLRNLFKTLFKKEVKNG